MKLAISDYHYLDIWRGAFYSVMLGILYQKFLTSLENALALHVLLFTILITVYLIFDGVTRFNSREIVRKHRLNYSEQSGLSADFGSDSKKNPIRSEVSWLVLEIIGLLVFTTWAYSMATLIDKSDSLKFKALFGLFDENYVFIGVFCILNFFHNAKMIRLDGDMGFLQYIKISMFSDISEQEQYARVWVNYLIERKEKSIKRFEKIKNDLNRKEAELIRPLKKKKNFKWIYLCRFFEGVISSLLAFIKYAKHSFMIGFLHIIFQYIAMHLIVYNFLAGIIILFSTQTGFSFFFSRIYLIISVLLLSFISFSVSSFFEIKRGLDISKFPAKKERVFQFLGNLFFGIFFVLMFLWMSKAFLVIWVVVEGSVFAYLLLRLAKPVKLVINEGG